MLIRNQDDYTLSLAKYLPSGELWNSKSISESNLYNLLYGLASILIDADIKTNELKEEFYPVNTEKFISEWEALLGIPDECLKNTGTLEERRNNVVGALGALGAITNEDWINLADIMGLEIKIEHMTDITAWPWTWPHVWGGTTQQNRFMIVITFLNISSAAIGQWPWTWSHVWGEDVSISIKCIFNRIKPAHIDIAYRYQ